MGLDDILRRCVLEHERDNIMHEAYYGPIGRDFQADTTAKKIQQSGLWRPTIHKDCKNFVSRCDRCQRLGRPLPSTEIPLISVNPSLTFEIWAIDFIGPFPIPAKWSGAWYIITAVEYVTKWAEAEPFDTCSSEVATKFIYENIITRFRCPLKLISDQGSHFINKTIDFKPTYHQNPLNYCRYPGKRNRKTKEE